MTTFSKSKGLVEANKDDGSIFAIHNAWKYMHVVGYFPLVHRAFTWFAHSKSAACLNSVAAFLMVLRKRDGGTKPKKENPFAVRYFPPLYSFSHPIFNC
jgi:hypothetical protein